LTSLSLLLGARGGEGEEVCECGHMPAFSGETTPYWLYRYHEPCDGLAADFVSRIE
jgi:hypothetical protein